MQNIREKSQAISIEDWLSAVKKEFEKDGFSSTSVDMKDWLIYYENGYTPERAYEEHMLSGIF